MGSFWPRKLLFGEFIFGLEKSRFLSVRLGLGNLFCGFVLAKETFFVGSFWPSNIGKLVVGSRVFRQWSPRPSKSRILQLHLQCTDVT